MRLAIDSATKLPREVWLSSILVGLFADVRSLNSVLISFLPISGEGIMSYLYLVLLILIFLLCIFKRRLINISASCVIIAAILSFFYLFTLFAIGQPEVSVIDFTVFTICAFLLPCFSQVDGKIMLRTMIFAPIIGVVKLNEIFALDDIVGSISMGLTYAFLPPVIATIVYVFTWFKNDSVKMKFLILIGSLINLLFLIRMMLYGSRGPILAVIGVLAFLFLVKKNTEVGVKINKKIAIVLIAILAILFANLENFLSFFDSILGAYNIDFRFIEKSLTLMSEDNLDHDRGTIAAMAWKGFFENPFFGNGLDRFMPNTGITYPHNFILQILYDGGLFLFIILLIPVLRGLLIKYRFCSLSSYMVLTTLFFASVPGALLSGNMWRQALLWLLMGAALSKGFFYINDKSLKYE